jgi:hypothetical protein
MPVWRPPRAPSLTAMFRPPTVVVVCAVLALSACSSSSDSAGADASSTTASPTGATSSTLLAPPTSSTTTLPPTTTSTSTTTSTTTIPPASTTSTTTTTEPGSELDGLVLSGDGIGPTAFGSDAQGTVDYLASFLGAPEQDTGWVDPLQLGPCPGTELRLISWGVLTVTLGDDSPVVSGRRHFVSYSYGIDGEVGEAPAGLQTAEGITIGSTVAEVRAAYPDVILNPEDEFVAANFYVSDDLRGYVTGVADDDVVTVIFGGQGCIQ